jgi:cell division protein FtsB
MIPNILISSNKKILLGSSYPLHANGLGGSSATPLFSFLKIPAVSLSLRALKQKGKKEGGWGEGIFALLRLRLERFRFSLIKRKPKQKIFHLLLKEKRGAKKIKNVIKKFLFWFAVAKRRQAETHQQNYQFSRSVRFRSEPPRARRVVSRGSVQKKLEFQPKGTAPQNKNSYNIAIFILRCGVF